MVAREAEMKRDGKMTVTAVKVKVEKERKIGMMRQTMLPRNRRL